MSIFCRNEEILILINNMKIYKNDNNDMVNKLYIILSISVWPHTFVSPSAFSRRAVVSYWRKYVHEVLVNRLGGLSLPRKSVVRLTDRPDMTLDVYRGHKTTTQKYYQFSFQNSCIYFPCYWNIDQYSLQLNFPASTAKKSYESVFVICSFFGKSTQKIVILCQSLY